MNILKSTGLHNAGKTALLLALAVLIAWTSFFPTTWKAQWHIFSGDIFSGTGAMYDIPTSFPLPVEVNNSSASDTEEPCAAEALRRGCPFRRKLRSSIYNTWPDRRDAEQQQEEAEAEAGGRGRGRGTAYVSDNEPWVSGGGGAPPAPWANSSRSGGIVPGSEARVVALLTDVRCGSCWIRDVLREHESIHAIGALFLNYGFEKAVHAGLVRSRGHFLDNFLNCEVAKAKNPNHFAKKKEACLQSPYRLYKLMYGQAHSEILAWHMQHNFSIIHLVRRNLFRRGVSVEHMKKQDLSKLHDIEAKGGLENLQLNVNVNDFVRLMAKYESKVQHAKKVLDKFGIPHVTVYYEDFMVPELKDKNWNTIMDLLGLPHSPFPGKSGSSAGQIHATHNYADEIVNYQEVERAIKAKGWGW
eukprot:CAMPEP_0113939182 /NCGR_PEP_ID=MMETSP1339-20121228/5539_1 /TAXON_ID=94617 /ORGANISM="Fibrocapsa japonica" /LENGTH=413 /DNA_ID=CAMNT_0000942605 /DNA_START=30 /DNA_END=1268 /DNA_ORIENTATION=+ /assembly_acc=CAM_ASM_000762